MFNKRTLLYISTTKSHYFDLRRANNFFHRLCSDPLFFNSAVGPSCMYVLTLNDKIYDFQQQIQVGNLQCTMFCTSRPTTIVVSGYRLEISTSYIYHLILSIIRLILVYVYHIIQICAYKSLSFSLSSALKIYRFALGDSVHVLSRNQSNNMHTVRIFFKSLIALKNVLLRINMYEIIRKSYLIQRENLVNQ